MDAYVIIGDANTRKSSVMRSLTGCFNRSVRQIETRNSTTLDVYARVSSLQESETEPSAFLQEVLKTGQQCVVLCLWPQANPLNPSKYPDAHAYLSAFSAAGWQFRSCAILGNSGISPAIPNVARFPNVLQQPINVTAQAVRTHFGWH